MRQLSNVTIVGSTTGEAEALMIFTHCQAVNESKCRIHILQDWTAN